jgi:hypothetical protein
MKPQKDRIVCLDEFSISIRASRTHYCSPREDEGPYSRVECGFPSKTPGKELMKYAENASDPTDTVYGYVPIDVVRRELLSHGPLLLHPMGMSVDDFLASL